MRSAFTLCCCCCCCCFVGLRTVSAPVAEFFVDALHGADDASGLTTNAAFATVRRAQRAVRQQLPPRNASADDGSPLAIVSLRSAGTHWIHRSANSSTPQQWAPGSLLFSRPDSGTPERPVVWRTYPADAATAVISAGIAVPSAGWQPATNDPGLQQAVIPEVAAGHACPQQLWAGGLRLTRARLPRAGFAQWDTPIDPANLTASANSHGFVYRAGFDQHAERILSAAQGPAGLSAANISVVTMHIWGDSHSKLDAINLTARSLHWVAPSSTPVGLYEHGMPGSTGRRFFIDNTVVGLAAPGSWHIDCGTGLLQYRPREGENVASMEFVAAGADEVIVLGSPVDRDPEAAQVLRDAMERHKATNLVGQQFDAVDPCGDPAAAEVYQASSRVGRAHVANGRDTSGADSDGTGVASNLVFSRLVLAHNNFLCSSVHACGEKTALF